MPPGLRPGSELRRQCCRYRSRQSSLFPQTRNIQISTNPSADTDLLASEQPTENIGTSGNPNRLSVPGLNINKSLDATFSIIASPDPLLSVSLSPSQNLYTRRGTLVGVSGKTENVCYYNLISPKSRQKVHAKHLQAVSTLSILEPFRRAVLRIPFLYQRIASTTPIKALISTKSSERSLAVVHLDGTLDWMLAGKALLAWTGQTLSVRPTLNRQMVHTSSSTPGNPTNRLIAQEPGALG